MHRCPKRGCQESVPNHLFACRPHWYALTPETRALVYQTAQLNLLTERRREAIDRARKEWGDL